METKKKSLKQWQKEYPDAVQIKGKAIGWLNDKQLLFMAFGDNPNARILENSSVYKWDSKRWVWMMKINYIATKTPPKADASIQL
jgi:hypothetical protein